MAASTPPGPYKPTLGKSETNRLKTETSRQRKTAADAAADKTVAFTPPPPPPTGPSSTATIADPMARRDTSTGKLRRVQSAEETANALAPVGDSGEPKRTETVRLKVVRNTRSELQNVVPEGQAAAAPSRPASGTLAVPPPVAAGAAPKPQAVPAASVPGAAPAEARRVTSTVRGEPPAEPEDTVAEPAAAEAPSPGQTQATPAFSNTGTSTIKLQIQKPLRPAGAPSPATAVPGKVATATLKIRPPGAPGSAPAPGAVPGAKPAANKDATATLKIRPPTEAAPAADAAAAAAAVSTPAAAAVSTPAAAPEAARDVTSVLKMRPGGLGAKPAPSPEPESGATVRIRPPVAAPPKPAAGVAADDETQVGAAAPAAPPVAGEKPKMSLKLKKDEAAKPVKREVTIPGLGEKQTPPAAETADASMTVAVTPMAAAPAAAGSAGEDAASATVVMAPADETTGADKKKSLRLKAGKGKEDAAADAAHGEAGVSLEDIPVAAAPVAGAGPGRLAAAAALLAFAGVAALVIRLLLDLRRYM